MTQGNGRNQASCPASLFVFKDIFQSKHIPMIKIKVGFFILPV